MDGVLTPTALLHRRAWKQMFDAFLRTSAACPPGRFVPFDDAADYLRYVDGKPREDGTRDFLRSRGIVLPEGSADDPPQAETVRGLGARKNTIVRGLLTREGVRPYPDASRYLRAVRRAGLPMAVVSSSVNTGAVLAAAGLQGWFDAVVDAVVAAERGLAGKPAPDTFLAAAQALGSQPAAAAVFEDALAGVAAARAGGLGWVVGVDRAGDGASLRRAGADEVVRSLDALLVRS